jgi:hypothetical protein
MTCAASMRGSGRPQEARGHRRRGRDQPDRAVRGRPGHRRRRHRRRPRRLPLPRPGPPRRLQRDRADRGVLRPAQALPAVPAREPPARPRHPHGRDHPDPPRHSRGRAYYDKKLAEGKTPKEALRALKRQISNAIFACLQADTRRAADRRGITTAGQVALMTLGYREVVIRIRKSAGTWVPVPGRPAQSGASASPTETPQPSDTAADPHRNPTDETAHSGTLVMRVKDTENSRSAASMRVSWAVGGFSR